MDDDDDVEHLRQKVRRLRRQIHLLEEENGDLRRRAAFVCQELEQTRAKITTALRTS